MVLLRSIVFNLCFYALLIALMLLGAPTLLGNPSAVKAHARRWARLSLALLDHVCHCKVEFRGLEHVPPGGAIIASKHQSFLDILVLIHSVHEFTFIYKRELGFIPIFGSFLRRSGQIELDRAKRGAAMTQLIAATRKAFAANRRLLIFPEGTRRAVGAPPAYKPGVARIAEETGAICVPVALNSGLFWPRRKFIRRPGTVIVEFLAPILPEQDRESFMRRLSGEIDEASNRLVADALAKDPLLAAAIPKAPASSI